MKRRWLCAVLLVSLTGCGASASPSSAHPKDGGSKPAPASGGRSGGAGDAALPGGDAKDAGHPSVTLASFADGDWLLHVDRVWDGKSGHIQFPTDSFSDSDYKAVSQSTDYAVAVSSSGAAISIGSMAFKGARKPDSADRILFDLSAGTFAGGRFVVWVGLTTLEAELTIYGSGLPIVKSERGSLVRK
jgi:hypothetical protein